MSLVLLYFLINSSYSLFMFCFYHGILVDVIVDTDKKVREDVRLKGKLNLGELTPSKISITLNMIYFIYVLTGCFSLLAQFIKLVSKPSKCLWLHRIYHKKEKK